MHLLPNSYVKVTNGETVVYLAKTMEVRYTSLGYRQENDVTMREAFNSTADNGIVTLLADDLDAWADVSGKTVTLDFNGHWLSENGIDPESLRGYPIQRSYGLTLNFGF